MMVSLEARAVFLDNDVVDFCARLPHGYKYRRGVRKFLLRRAAEGLVPETVLKRPKKGFGIPLARWLRQMPPAPPLGAVPGLRPAWIAERWSAARAGRGGRAAAAVELAEPARHRRPERERGRCRMTRLAGDWLARVVRDMRGAFWLWLRRLAVSLFYSLARDRLRASCCIRSARPWPACSPSPSCCRSPGSRMAGVSFRDRPRDHFQPLRFAISTTAASSSRSAACTGSPKSPAGATCSASPGTG